MVGLYSHKMVGLDEMKELQLNGVCDPALVEQGDGRIIILDEMVILCLNDGLLRKCEQNFTSTRSR